MRSLPRVGRTFLFFGLFAVASHFAVEYGSGGLWKGLRPAHAVVGGPAEATYDLTQLRAVNATLDSIRKKYVEPERVEPRQMFLGALDQIQKEVAQVIVTHDENSPTVRVRVLDKEESFRVDNVQGPWDVAARLREVFVFLTEHLKGQKVSLPEVEYAASNGMLRTLDPHSVFLSPEDFRDMNVSTSGHFGGLGIVISIRDQALTVMRPMPGTPAGRAGVRRLDRITAINGESTLNMPLEDAVDRLRGEPGSKVTVWIHRDGKDGWNGSRPFELLREVIRVSSVEHKKLEGGFGYVRLKQFQQTTARELESALEALRGQGALGGLVLDLRDNPGGLLDQAGKVADMFLEEGTIYATQGASEGRHEQRATKAGTEPNYPIIVLVNGSSASASEIVSGALKNQERAVIVGQTTFGKGSVQLVFPDVTKEGAALKLTIAQYLTPGDISIQGTGVTPDVELLAMTPDMLEMDLFKDEGAIKERDLMKTLGAGGRRKAEPSRYQLGYYLPESLRAEIRDRGQVLDDELVVDTPIRLAAELLRSMSAGPREKQLAALQPKVRELSMREMKLVEKELGSLGIDFSGPPEGQKGSAEPEVETRVSTDRAGDTALAGEAMNLTVEVKNRGKVPLYRLSAVTKSDAGYYDQKELVIGKIAPGETKRATVPLGYCMVPGRKPGSSAPLPTNAARECRIPKSALTRQDVVQIRFSAEGGSAPRDLEFRPTIKALPQPVFAYSYQLVDGRGASENGQLEPGESASIHLRVKNVGEGAALETQANLRNMTGEGVALRAGRFDLGEMKPGEEREVEFTFDTAPNLSQAEVFLQLSVSDRDLGLGTGEKLSFPLAIGSSATKLVPGPGAEAALVDVFLLDAPTPKASALGRITKGTVVETLGTVGDFFSIRLAEGRSAFAPRKDFAKAAAKPAGKLVWEPILSRSPPRLRVNSAALATRGDKIRIEGLATDPTGGVQDVFVFVGSRKVYYQPNPSKDRVEFPLSLEVPLKPGVNLVTVVARENEDSATRTTLVVRKDGPMGEVLPTPRNELFGEDWEFGQE